MEEQINPRRHTCLVLNKKQLSEKVFEIDLALKNPEGIQFTPGQFVNITVAENVYRQYSIASSPSRSTVITLVVDVAPGGPGSKYFAAIQIEDVAEISSPMGRFGLASETGPIIFLAASTGIAPFKSMIDCLVEKQTADNDAGGRMLYLYLSFRFEKDIFWNDYFESLEKEHTNFHYQLTLSQPSESWNGCRGYVQSCVDKQLLKNPAAHFYICGGNKMVQGVLEYLRQEHIPEEQVHFEPF